MADEAQDPKLRIFARRATCLVFGNVGVRDLRERIVELLERVEPVRAWGDRTRRGPGAHGAVTIRRRPAIRRGRAQLAQEPLAVPLSLAMLDLDHFKSINDRFGHDIGDQVLVRVAGLLCDVLRESDVVVRSGGEEFLVLMPLTDARATTTPSCLQSQGAGWVRPTDLTYAC